MPLKSSCYQSRAAMEESTCIVVVTDKSLLGDHYVERSNRMKNRDFHGKVTVKTGDKQIWKNKTSDIIDSSNDSVTAHTKVPMLTTIPKDLSEFYSQGIFQGYVHIAKEITKLKDQYEEQTASKFILYSQTKNFGDGDWMKGKHRVLWEITPNSKSGVSLPFQGIPFFVVGHAIYDCQNGRDRNLRKKRLRMKNDCIKHSATKKRKTQYPDSKKFDCPAQIFLREVIMFPEFKLAIDSHKRRQSASQKLRWGIELHKEGKDMLLTERRIYIYFPRPGEHKNHVTGEDTGGKFLEPVDPRITEKIHTLTRQGVTGIKKVREHINTFVQDILEDSTAPSVDRRRYNPCDQDIRNAIKKAQTDMKKSSRRALEMQCSSLMMRIGKQLMSVKNDSYLKQMRDHLLNLYSLIRNEESLEPLLLSRKLDEKMDLVIQPPCKKMKARQNKKDISETNVHITSHSTTKPCNITEDDFQDQQNNKASSFKQEAVETLVYLPGASGTSSYNYDNNYENGQLREIIYQEEVPHNSEANVDGVTQIYYYQKMPSQGDIFNLANQSDCNQVAYNLPDLKDTLG